MVLNLNGQSFAAPTAQYATLAALVVALEQQVEAAAGGDIVSMVTNDVTNTVTVTANAGTDQAAMVASLTITADNEIVAVDRSADIHADLSLSASRMSTRPTSRRLVRCSGTMAAPTRCSVSRASWVQRMRISSAGDDLENYLAAGAGDDISPVMDGDDELFGGEGNDYIYGGDGDDYIVGGAGVDLLFGGSGRDVYAVDLGSVDTIRDFGVSAILSSAAGRGGVNDQVEFGFTEDIQDLTGLFGSVPRWLVGTVPVADRCRRLPRTRFSY